jgi:hypothetical protein
MGLHNQKKYANDRNKKSGKDLTDTFPRDFPEGDSFGYFRPGHFAAFAAKSPPRYQSALREVLPVRAVAAE